MTSLHNLTLIDSEAVSVANHSGYAWTQQRRRSCGRAPVNSSARLTSETFRCCRHSFSQLNQLAIWESSLTANFHCRRTSRNYVHLATIITRGKPYKIFVITRRMNVRRHFLLNVLPAGLWNSLPPSIVNISSLLLFKKTINNVHVNLFTRYWSLICLCSLQLCVVIVSFLPIAICITRLCDMLVALYR